MGNWLNSLFNKKKDVRIVMIGLDNAGKTTILYKLKLGEIVTTIPTIGFNVETVTRAGLCMNVWDIGGQSKIRPLWHHYYQGTHGIIFVVDSTDHERFTNSDKNGNESVYGELTSILTTDLLKGVPLLIMANKCDSVNAKSTTSICTILNLYSVKNRPWNCIATSALTGEGIDVGLQWLSKQVK